MRSKLPADNSKNFPQLQHCRRVDVKNDSNSLCSNGRDCAMCALEMCKIENFPLPSLTSEQNCLHIFYIEHRFIALQKQGEIYLSILNLHNFDAKFPQI